MHKNQLTACVLVLGDETRREVRTRPGGVAEAQLLEDASIKLGSVASDIRGITGRRIIRALIAGQQRTEWLTALSTSRLRDRSLGRMSLNCAWLTPRLFQAPEANGRAASAPPDYPR